MNVERDEPLPAPDRIAGVIISGSHAMVTEQRPWSEKTAAWLRGAHTRVPILGICYGHQLLGYALGGKVADNPAGREMGTATINFNEQAGHDPLFADSAGAIRAQVSHKQSLLALPPGAVLLGGSAGDPHQAFRCAASSWGVQFHPEFDAAVTRTYIDHCAQLLRDEGQDPEQLKEHCTESASGPALLQRFAAIVKQKNL